MNKMSTKRTLYDSVGAYRTVRNFPIGFGCTGEVKRFLQNRCGKYIRCNDFGEDTYLFDSGEAVVIKGKVINRAIRFVGESDSELLKGLEKEAQRGALAA